MIVEVLISVKKTKNKKKQSNTHKMIMIFILFFPPLSFNFTKLYLIKSSGNRISMNCLKLCQLTLCYFE